MSKPTFDLRTAHDVRRLRTCRACGGMGDGKFMPIIDGHPIHGFCAAEALGVAGLAKLPEAEIDKLTLSEIGPERMKALLAELSS